jgi:hypothetical protein
MNRQIEDMTKLSTRCAAECEDWCTCSEKEHAEILYNAGYRKASEVAREIIDAIKASSSYCVEECNGMEIYGTKTYTIKATKLDEILKKYESEGADDDCN